MMDKVTYTSAVFGLFFIIFATRVKTDSITSNFQKLLDLNHHNEQKFVNFIKKGYCKHIYLDMGTNRGIQIRKLYEPALYSKSPVLPLFDTAFNPNKLSPELWAKNVCALGFEANSVHTAHLIDLQTSYQKAGYPCVVLTDTAVATFNGNITFYHDLAANKIFNEWGASYIPWDKDHGMKQHGVMAVAVDTNSLIHRFHHTWEKSGFYNESQSKIVAKMDIEGAEFDVIPHLLLLGSLCLIDYVYLEWHPKFHPKMIANASISEKEILQPYSDMLKAVNLVSACKFKELDIDDEEYGYGHDNHPYPAARNNSNLTILRRVR